jgi:DNA-directed RNA polymerase subunit L
MNPRVENVTENDNSLTFTLKGVNVSLANAIRRTILSDIPTVVFKTTPYEENKANILENTTRLNNEIIKQRLSCIPIYITDLDMPLKNYLLEVNVENITDNIIFVTTENFKIKNLITNQYLSEKDTRNIFPPNDYTGYFIDFVRLRPKISEEIIGEKINLTCEFSIGTAKEDGSFNVVSTCSYGFTPDDIKIEEELRKKIQQWKDDGLSKDSIEFESKNWKLLEALRIVKQDSFDFIIQSIGVFTNDEILNKACEIIIQRLNELDTIIESDEIKIERSLNTMDNSFDIILENEDYTIGKIIEYMFYSKFFESMKTLTFCGFKKMHPHDSESIIRIAYKDSIDKSGIKQNLKECVIDSINVFQKIKKEFLKIMKN